MTYRKFDSRHGWNRPATPGWLGWTWGIRVTFVVAILWVALR